MSEHKTTVLIEPLDRERVLLQALYRAAAPIPSTKGMDPKARALRLHAELARRISEAKEVINAV